MAHAKPQHLKGFETLLDEIRMTSLLKEKSFGCFYNKGKGVLHFHIKGERIYAHVYTGKSWKEVDLKLPLSEAKQKALAKKMLNLLQ